MDSTRALSQHDIETSAYFANVYRWMTGALILSALVAWWGAHSAKWVSLLTQGSGLMFGLIILELVLVVALAAGIRRMSLGVAVACFLGYAAITGLTLSTIFLIYTASSIVKVFIVTAVSFAGLSLYGTFTKRNLGAMGGFLYMSLFGLIIATFLNFFFRSPAIEWITAYGGVVIFAGLTAYDTQKLRALNQIGNMGTADDHKEAIYGALTLYLDFINLFLHLLRIMGNQRQ